MCSPELWEEGRILEPAEAAPALQQQRVLPSSVTLSRLFRLWKEFQSEKRSDAEVRGQADVFSPVVDFQGCAEEFSLYFPQAKAGEVMGRAGGAYPGAPSLTTRPERQEFAFPL